jgi:hypothetical protein
MSLAERLRARARKRLPVRPAEDRSAIVLHESTGLRVDVLERHLFVFLSKEDTREMAACCRGMRRRWGVEWLSMPTLRPKDDGAPLDVRLVSSRTAGYSPPTRLLSARLATIPASSPQP